MLFLPCTFFLFNVIPLSREKKLSALSKAQNIPKLELHQLLQWPLDFYRQMTNSKVHQKLLACRNMQNVKSTQE
jgi:hypothetical protein